MSGDAKEASNWVTNQVLQTLNEQNLKDIRTFPLGAAVLADVIGKRKDGLNPQRLREVYARMSAQPQRRSGHSRTGHQSHG